MPQAIIPAIIGGGFSLLSQKSAKDASKRAYDVEQEKARQAYGMRTRRFQDALKKYNLKKGLVGDFITQHGLTPGKGVMDYLHAPDPTAPTFEEAGSTPYGGGPAMDYAGAGRSAAMAAAKLLAPKAAGPMAPQDQSFMGATDASAQNGGDWKNPTGAGPGITPQPELSIDDIVNKDFTK